MTLEVRFGLATIMPDEFCYCFVSGLLKAGAKIDNFDRTDSHYLNIWQIGRKERFFVV
jgi:hypothetical protein